MDEYPIQNPSNLIQNTNFTYLFIMNASNHFDNNVSIKAHGNWSSFELKQTEETQDLLLKRLDALEQQNEELASELFSLRTSIDLLTRALKVVSKSL